MVDWGCVMAMTEEERKASRRESQRKYDEANREKKREAGRNYYAKNKDKYVDWKVANPELVKKYSREYARRKYAADPNHIKKIERDYRNNNVETCRLRAQKWRKNNPDRIQIFMQDYRKTNRAELLVYNIKRHLADDLRCTIDEVPIELVETKCVIIQVKRKLKELSNEKSQ